jgi:iron-sulfur cluster assembly accessory protein
MTIKIRKKGEEKEQELLVAKASEGEIGISEDAAQHIKYLMEKEQKPFLRVSIRGGGCSGLTIHYEITDLKRGDDSYFSNEGAVVAIDKKSLSVLSGATVHCRDYLGSKELFLVNNPAEKQCSCGQSFSL